MHVTREFTFFYGSQEPFSNWFPARFEEADEGAGSISFPTSEHYMMYRKAQHFGDTRVAEKILATADPRRAKQLGRQVQGFVAKEWSRVARAYVYRGCRLKFTQNKASQAALLMTTNTQLVEASPTDIIWGVGLSERDERIMDPRNWRGTNWLGEVLTVLRDDLRAARCSLDQLPWGRI